MTTAQKIEDKLREAVRRRQAEWESSTEKTRDSTQQNFLQALQVFTAFIIDRKLPEGSVATFSRSTAEEDTP
jgi:hypothetical protein